MSLKIPVTRSSHPTAESITRPTRWRCSNFIRWIRKSSVAGQLRSSPQDSYLIATFIAAHSGPSSFECLAHWPTKLSIAVEQFRRQSVYVGQVDAKYHDTGCASVQEATASFAQYFARGECESSDRQIATVCHVCGFALATHFIYISVCFHVCFLSILYVLCAI